MTKPLVRLATVVALGFFGAVPPAAAQADYVLGAVGGGGGTEFKARCPSGQHLLGFNLRAGHDIDAIQPICGIPQSPEQVRVAGEMPRFGGGGGQPAQVICPATVPVVLGIFVRAEGMRGQVVSSIRLYCGLVAAQQRRPEYAAAIFDAPKQDDPQSQVRDHFCPAGLIGVGVHGAAGALVDRLGLICGAPQTGFTETAGRTLGKRKLPEDDTAGRTLGRRRRLGDAAATSSAAEEGVRANMRGRVDPAIYDQYVGRYLLPSTETITITREGDRLYSITGQKLELFPETETKFLLGPTDFTITFEKSSGRVVALVLAVGGGSGQRATRIPN